MTNRLNAKFLNPKGSVQTRQLREAEAISGQRRSTAIECPAVSVMSGREQRRAGRRNSRGEEGAMRGQGQGRGRRGMRERFETGRKRSKGRDGRGPRDGKEEEGEG